VTLKGRLGLDEARIPHRDRHGLLWLQKGELSVQDGSLRFQAAESDRFDAGEYQVPHQSLSLILLEPGTTVTHDALRLLANHGTGLVAVGDGGTRFYTAPPVGTDNAKLARHQTQIWSKPAAKKQVVLDMYEFRMGRTLQERDIEALRGIEGARMKETYRRVAEKHGINWNGRRYDRDNPDRNDDPNQALNHAATAMEAAAFVAVSATGTIPQLGFIHESSTIAFVLDVSDLFRTEITIPLAFRAVKESQREGGKLERHVRREACSVFRNQNVISDMIDRIQELLDPESVDGKLRGDGEEDA
jgi:CRISPR-associated protein Cas1